MRKSLVPMSIVCCGDSLTEGNPHAEADKWSTRLQWHLDQERPGNFKVYNRGVAGNTTIHGLDRIGEAVLPLLPGCVFIQFGFNDCNVRPDRRTPRVGLGEFVSNLGELVRMVRAFGGVPTLVAPHHPESDRRPVELRKYDQGNSKTYADNYQPYYLAIQRVAAECKTPLIDVPALLISAKMKTTDLVIADGIHLTIEGNHFYAREIQRHLLSMA